MKTSTKWLLGILIGVIIIGAGLVVWQKFWPKTSTSNQQSTDSLPHCSAQITDLCIDEEGNDPRLINASMYSELETAKSKDGVFKDAQLMNILIATEKFPDEIFNNKPSHVYIFKGQDGLPYQFHVDYQTGAYTIVKWGSSNSLSDLQVIDPLLWKIDYDQALSIAKDKFAQYDKKYPNSNSGVGLAFLSHKNDKNLLWTITYHVSKEYYDKNPSITPMALWINGETGVIEQSRNVPQ